MERLASRYERVIWRARDEMTVKNFYSDMAREMISEGDSKSVVRCKEKSDR